MRTCGTSIRAFDDRETPFPIDDQVAPAIGLNQIGKRKKIPEALPVDTTGILLPHDASTKLTETLARIRGGDFC